MPDADIVPPDMRLELQKFDEDAGKLIASSFGTIDPTKWPPIIYHYTTDVGLRGILETGKLWLTDIFNLNDPSELSHGFSHVVNILNSKAVDSSPESKVFSRAIEAFHMKGGIQESAHFFVCAFSSDGDDLGQWRAYADNGRGYALGFDAERLVTAFTKNGGARILNVSTFPVTYDDGKVAELQRQLVERMFRLKSLHRDRGLADAVIHEYLNNLFGLLVMHAVHAAIFFKHEAYNNEKELRFLQMHRGGVPAPGVKYRNRPYSLIKYREFDWRKSASGALKEIVIGPAADHDKAFQFATDCLRSFHGTVFEPARSKIPYRAT